MFRMSRCLGAHCGANRDLAAARGDGERKHAIDPHQRQHASHERKPDQQLHRESARCQRIAANLLQRLNVFDGDRRIDGAQLALDGGRQERGSAAVRTTRCFENAAACHSER